MVTQLWNDDAGVIISAELVLVLTIGVLAMVVGLHAVAKSATQELNDVANALGTIDQSFIYLGLKKANGNKFGHAAVPGSAFKDGRDECDCTIIVQSKPDVKRDGGDRESGSGR